MIFAFGRDLQSLQKCCRDLESAKVEAQSEVQSLSQRYNINLLAYLCVSPGAFE